MQPSTLATRLWIIFGAITVALIGCIQFSKGLGIEYGLISGVAFLGWCRWSTKSVRYQVDLVPYYIGSIVCLLILNTIRYATHAHEFIQLIYPFGGHSSGASGYANWFLPQVCLPVSGLLIGGYLLSKRQRIGLFFAWWGFLFGVAESLLQFIIDLTHPASYLPLYIVGTLTAMGLFYVSACGLLRLSKPKVGNRPSIEQANPLTTRQINLWSMLFISFMAVYAVTLYVQAGLLPVGVIMGSMMGGLIGWRKTTARYWVDPYQLVPLYLLLQALFYIHVGEEVLTHFNQQITALSGHAWPDEEFNYLITLVGPAIWVLAAYSLWRGQAFGHFILWFMIVGMILGEPTHIVVFPVVRLLRQGGGYTYFSGMYTALFPMIPAILALFRIVSETKKQSSDIYEKQA
ncbi:hypothetical protein [Spirosoma radiotolerans]|uniref:Uncharacterized protein n=1 Tax=Spirosoma radiotolerans TaxID=1379870 RepID=A0A0E3ZTC1_9BACT|nr:hypothetical protein [Spirosoma radiotolerans]AKD54864.1 hypothetical protein SD10_08075 [Spirosoma radiotolerans]